MQDLPGLFHLQATKVQFKLLYAKKDKGREVGELMDMIGKSR